MDKEKVKEARSFAITAIVFGFLLTGLTILMVYKGKGDEAGIVPIGAGILFAIGFHLLPKANRRLRELEREEKNIQ